MYWVGYKDKSSSLTGRARDMGSKINIEILNQHADAENVYLNDDGNIKPIFENISVTELLNDQYNNWIISYNEQIQNEGTS